GDREATREPAEGAAPSFGSMEDFVPDSGSTTRTRADRRALRRASGSTRASAARQQRTSALVRTYRAPSRLFRWSLRARSQGDHVDDRPPGSHPRFGAAARTAERFSVPGLAPPTTQPGGRRRERRDACRTVAGALR